MNWKELAEILRKGEDDHVEFKTKEFLKDKNEIAAQLTSFANRFGGTILVGVNNHGELEGEKIDRDSSLLKITNISQDKCSPTVEFTTEFLTSTKGDVLIVKVEKRRGRPHAVVTKSGDQIRNRIYYLRKGNRKTFINDELLSYLFTHTEDPTLNLDYDIHVQYYRQNPKISPITTYRIYHPIFEFVSFLNELTDDDVKYLLENESDRIGSLYSELLPYAMLNYLSRIFSSSWLVKIERRPGSMTISPIKCDKKEIRYKQITLPRSPVISQLSIDLINILSKNFFRLAVPPQTKVELNFLEKHRSKLTFTHENAFKFEFSFTGGSWLVGAGGLAPAYGLLDRFNDQYAFSKEVATLRIKSKFTGTFKYPEIDQSFNDYYYWGETIIDFLKRDWDWGSFIEKIPENILFSIENYAKRILEILERKDKDK